MKTVNANIHLNHRCIKKHQQQLTPKAIA